VNEPPSGGDWEPAAEIPSRAFQRRRISLAISVSERLICTQTLERTFKDREDNASQLNRLGLAYFHLAYFRFQPEIHRLFVGATAVSIAISVIQVRTTSNNLLDI
jgi:hypothetical protein